MNPQIRIISALALVAAIATVVSAPLHSRAGRPEPLAAQAGPLAAATAAGDLRFHYIRVDDRRGRWGDFDPPAWLRYFGLDAGDLDRDGSLDLVSGRYVYRNPAGDMTGPWRRTDLGANVDGMLVIDVEGLGRPGIIATALPEVFWCESEDETLSRWRRTVIGSLPKTGHVNGQGYARADLTRDGRPEVLLAAADGIYAARVPKTPASQPWSWLRLVARGSDEGVAVADIDGDGLPDLVGGDGPPGEETPTLVAWWKNPGTWTADWQRREIGRTLHAIDRVVAADFNGDGRMDVAVSEERYPGKEPDAHLWWFEAASGADSPFIRHLLVRQYSMNNLDAGDLDGDGHVDLVTCEHKGPHLRLQWFRNDGAGNFAIHEIDRGKESHLGARVFDLNGNGRLDIVSHAWDNWKDLHLWRNDGPAPHATHPPAAKRDLSRSDLAEGAPLVAGRLAGLGLTTFLAAQPPAASHEITVSGTRFLLNGEPFPWTGVSFFNAIYNPAFNQSSKDRLQWLAKFQDYGINVLRIWAQWDNARGFIDAGPEKTLYYPDGRLRKEHLQTLQDMLGDADRLGVVVELALFSHESYREGIRLGPEAAVRAVGELARQLQPHRNLVIQIWNEHHDDQVLPLVQVIRRIDPKRLVTSSPGFAGVLGPKELNEALDFLTPHTSRQGRGKTWEIAPQEIAGLLREINKPVVDDEPARNGTAQFGGPKEPTAPTDHILHIWEVWKVGGHPIYHHDMFQTGYGTPACPPHGVPDPEFSPYHRQVFEFLRLRARYGPEN